MIGRGLRLVVAYVWQAPVVLSAVVVTCLVFAAQKRSGRWLGDIDEVWRTLGFSVSALIDGEWWRPFAANLVHTIRRGPGPVGLTHLVVNMGMLVLVGPYVEQQLGHLRFVVLYVLAGTLAYAWLVVPNPDVIYAGGASGAIYGITGAAVALAVLGGPTSGRDRAARAALLLFTAFLVFRGIQDPWDLGALTRHVHAAGFVAGAVLGALLRVRTWRPAVPAAMAVTVLVLAGAAVRVEALRGRAVDGTVFADVGDQPVAAVIDGDHAWVTGERTCRVATVSGQVGPCRRIGRNVRSIASAGGALWVTSELDDTVYRLEPSTLAVRGRIRVRHPVAVAYAFDSLWVGTSEGLLLRVDPEGGRTVTVATREGPISSLAVGAGRVWALSEGSARLIAAGPDGDLRSMDLPDHPDAVAAAGDAVWASLGQRVVEVDSQRMVVRRSVALGGEAFALAIDDEAVWAPLHWESEVVRVSRETGRVSGRYSTGVAHPSQVAVGRGALCAVDFLGGQVLLARPGRGGWRASLPGWPG